MVNRIGAGQIRTWHLLAWCTKVQASCTKVQAWCTKVQAWCTKVQAWCTKSQPWCTRARLEGSPGIEIMFRGVRPNGTAPLLAEPSPLRP